MKTIENQEMINFLNGLLEDDQPVKFVSSLTVDYFDDDTAEITFQLDLEKKVKPLFPTKEQGAEYCVAGDGVISKTYGISANAISIYAKQGRTFYTLEDAEAFVRRDQAKTYCLEAINRVNGGDNGFKLDGVNYYLSMTMKDLKLNYFDTFIQQSLENGMYIRTDEAAKELINDAEFVENWKIWKGVE